MSLNNLHNRRILVTGAAGFLGANLIRRLLNYPVEIYALVRTETDLWRLRDIADQVILLKVDLTDRLNLQDVITKCAPEIIFHFAVSTGHAKTVTERSRTLNSNILATVNLFEAALSLPIIKIIYAGSSLEYGQYDVPLDETLTLMPKTFRGATKAAATLLCQYYADTYQLPLVILRIFSAYGPWEPYRFIPKALLSALRGQEILLTEHSSYHDFIFVEDIITACLQAVRMQTLPGEIINIGSGEQWSNEEVITIIEKITNKKLNIGLEKYPNSPSDTHHWVANIQKAKTLLKWVPEHSLTQGLEKTLIWLGQYAECYLRTTA